MSEPPLQSREPVPPAMGERWARWGYGYQDKVGTERILKLLRRDIRDGTRTFEGVRLADLKAGKVDDFVLVSKESVEGSSIKWSAGAADFTWGELVGTSGLLRDLANGWNSLRSDWKGRTVTVRLHTNRPASREKHNAQLVPSISLAEFVTEHWASGPDAADSPHVSEAWRQISDHVGLAGAGLSDFVAHCELVFGQSEPPGGGPDTIDWRHYRKQFDSLHKAIATWLTDNPNRELIDRDYLLTAIGLRSRRSGLIQRFPEPDIPYEKNHAAADRLKALVEGFPGGYLAILGPAGVGKSTLVQDVLAESAYPYFVPYYAFLPSTDGNRDRAEALTFFQDVVARLDGFDSRRHSLGVADIAQGREALRHHMSSANQRYVLHGYKTILLIDGLDHVVREVDLQTSVLNELPPPSEVPEGFLIILSTQPQALLPTAIPATVAAQVAEESRRVEVSGLSREEVHTLVSKLTKTTTGEERDILYHASLGNPLILTYLLSWLEGGEDVSVATAVERAGNYDGRIDEYYLERLSVPLQDSKTRRLLGLLCRAVPTLSTTWLADWLEREAIEDLYQGVLAPFVRVDDGVMTFIHNSLIAFLRSATRSPLPGRDTVADERKFHSILADRSEGRPCIDPVGRARVVHLMRAERHADVLVQLCSDWLRSAVHGFLPYAHVHPVLLAGYDAASANGSSGHTLRLLLLSHELDSRTSRLDAATLADAMLDLDKPLLALSQIRSEGRLLVESNIALTFAGTLWWYAHQRGRSDLMAAARTLYLQAKPISLIHAGQPIEVGNYGDQLERVTAWSGIAPLFEQSNVVIQEIQNLVFTSRHEPHQTNPVVMTASLLFRALNTTLRASCSPKDCWAFVEAIHALGSKTWSFDALFRLAEWIPSEVDMESLRAAYELSEKNDDTRLAYAWFLNQRGDPSGAAQVIRRLPHIRFEAQGEHNWGFSDVTYTIWLRWLQELLGLPEGTVPRATDESEEAHARVEQAARQLGSLLAGVEKGEVPSDRHALFRSLLLFHNRPVYFAEMSQGHDLILHASRNAIYGQISKLAKAMGSAGLNALRDAVMDVTTGPSAPQFTPYHRRHFALLFHEEGTMPRDQVVTLGLSSTGGATDDDPSQRQESCLEIAAFLHRVGDQTGSENWTRKASEVSAGAGSHKDYHMAHLAEWLARSITETDSDRLEILDRFARAVEVSGGQGGSDGAATVLRLLLRLSPARAWQLAVEYIDRRVLNVSGVVEELLVGGSEARADPDLLSAMYGELHSLIAPSDTSRAATAVLMAYPRDQKRDAAERLMSYVRTNALPSLRVTVARALEEAIRSLGIETIKLTLGLQPGDDDSSRNTTLYRLANGDVETLGQIAERLSEPDHAETWNPNPGDNVGFDWWAAIREASVKDEQHFNNLIATFPPPDYREVDVLVRKAKVLLHSGNRQSAREVIEQAISCARNGSWHVWLDGAQKAMAFRALKEIDHVEGTEHAREQFAKDLSAGKISALFSLSDIGDTLEVLELDWPSDAVLDAVNDYLEQVLAANPSTQPYKSLIGSAPSWSVDQALCRFVCELLACPVVDVGVAARRALAKYVSANGKGLVRLPNDPPWWNPLQLEHPLAALHIGSVSASTDIGELREFVESLNHSTSLAVRSVAKRICDGRGWVWKDISTAATKPVIRVGRAPSTRHESAMVLGDDPAIGWRLHQGLIAPLLRAGLDADELWSEFCRAYWDIEGQYPWANEKRLDGWMTRLLTRFWISKQAIIGREAAMRVFGSRSLTGQVPPGAEAVYRRFYPIYDPELELYEPAERPAELQAMEWRFSTPDEEAWRRGANADEWNHYPDSVGGLSFIGERTRFVRPERTWPYEVRHRGLIVDLPFEGEASALMSAFALTYRAYLDGEGQNDKQLVVLNHENHHLVGPAHRWAAINSNIARTLGWHPSNNIPFRWLDSSGNLMVESTYWRDGWVWIARPQFESLGEGWFVSASPAAIEAIRQLEPRTEIHLWVERHSHGDLPYEGKWHLSRAL